MLWNSIFFFYSSQVTGMREIVQKAAAYITCGNKLLVFSHVDFPEAGIQIPCGTVLEGEDIDHAVLREAFEETGLFDLEIVRFLGTRVYQVQPREGHQREDHRHYYHLRMPGDIEVARWQHLEKDPSDGTPVPIRFELFWVDISAGVPELSGNQGDLLSCIVHDMGAQAEEAHG